MTTKSSSNWFEQYGITDPYYSDKYRVIVKGDCREVLSSVHGVSAVVTDPPYELGFMGKSWDSKGVSFQPTTWSIIRQSCKSGAPMLSFGGTRTQHRIACAIEDAGWEIRDCIMYVYGSGFPKSLNVGKAIDKLQGNERDVIGTGVSGQADTHKSSYQMSQQVNSTFGGKFDVTRGSSIWEGWGTTLKPAYEPIILAMNPLDKTFANNALVHGVAGLNIDGCRVSLNGDKPRVQNKGESHTNTYNWATGGGIYKSGGIPETGRFPANLIHDGSDEVLELFPFSKDGVAVGGKGNATSIYGSDLVKHKAGNQGYGGSGSAARFFYCVKASRSERDSGCDELEPEQSDESRKEGNPGGDNPRNQGVNKVYNTHPTVKPLALMEYLCKLVKMPQYNLILDPFCGSGTTLLACTSLGIRSIGIDSDEKSCEIAANRCAADTIARIQRGEY